MMLLLAHQFLPTYVNLIFPEKLSFLDQTAMVFCSYRLEKMLVCQFIIYLCLCCFCGQHYSSSKFQSVRFEAAKLSVHVKSQSMLYDDSRECMSFCLDVFHHFCICHLGAYLIMSLAIECLSLFCQLYTYNLSCVFLYCLP